MYFQNTILNENTMQWKNFIDVPVPFFINVYFFNITNAAEILQGGKPIVKEAGPYVYRQVRCRTTSELIYLDR